MRRVLIVGGGIAGPVLGMWLKRLGMEVSITEARPAAALGEGAFLGVAPNGMNAWNRSEWPPSWLQRERRVKRSSSSIEGVSPSAPLIAAGMRARSAGPSR